MDIRKFQISCLLQLHHFSIHNSIEQLQQSCYALHLSIVLCRRCQHYIHIVVTCCLLNRRQRYIVEHTAISIQLLADFNRHEQKRNTCSCKHPRRRGSLHMTRIVIKSGDRYLHTVHCTGCHVLQKESCESGIVDDVVALAVCALDSLHRCKLHPLRDALVFHEVCEPCTVMSAVIQTAEQCTT